MGKKKEKKVVDEKVDVDNEDETCWWFVRKGVRALFLCISVFALLVRVAVSLHPYSGAGNSPKFGVMRRRGIGWRSLSIFPFWNGIITAPLMISATGVLDYPPLTAYQSYFDGLFLRFFDPDSVTLFTSRKPIWENC